MSKTMKKALPPPKTKASGCCRHRRPVLGRSSHRHRSQDGLAVHYTDYLVDPDDHPASSSPSPPPISSLPPAIQRLVMTAAFTGACCCCRRSCSLRSRLSLPQLFLMLPWLPSSPFHCSACFANTGCCCRNSGSCDGASWVRAPGVPRPHSRRLLHLLDLLH